MDIFLDSHFWFLAIRLGTAELDNTNHKQYCLVLNKYNILNIQIHFFLKHEKHKPFFDGTKIKFDVRVFLLHWWQHTHARHKISEKNWMASAFAFKFWTYFGKLIAQIISWLNNENIKMAKRLPISSSGWKGKGLLT